MNTQESEGIVTPNDGALDVHSVFYTVQGEGPFVGRPAVFVRLAGCNLQCPLCDTDYTSVRNLTSPGRLLLAVHEAERGYGAEPTAGGLIVVTGGEPFRQPLGPFLEEAHRHAYEVQVETNGTLFDPSVRERLWDVLTVVCSPKTPELSHRLKPKISCLKYVLKAGETDTDGLPKSSLDFGLRPCRPWSGFFGEVYVQPCDEGDPVKNAANVKAAVESCMRHGHRLCLQTHKIAGLP